MNNKNKLFGIIALIAIAFFGWAFMGCEDKDDDPPPDPAVPQTYTTKGTFSGQKDVIIKGNFSNADWNGTNNNGIKNKVENALNGAYAVSNIRSDYNNVFARNVTITVKTFTAPNADKTWETTNDGKTLYVNTTKLDNLQSCFDTIIDKMYDKIATVQ